MSLDLSILAIVDMYSPLTTVKVSGDGEIIMVVGKVNVGDGVDSSNTKVVKTRHIPTLDRIYTSYMERVGSFKSV